MPAPLRRAALLSFCRSLPSVTQDVKWDNDLCFSIGGKIFAVFGVVGGARFSCKSTPGDFAVLTELRGIVPAPYLARYHWIAIEDRRALPEAEARALIRRSYELVRANLSQKVRAALAVAENAGVRAALPARRSRSVARNSARSRGRSRDSRGAPASG